MLFNEYEWLLWEKEKHNIYVCMKEAYTLVLLKLECYKFEILSLMYDNVRVYVFMQDKYLNCWEDVEKYIFDI